MLPYMSASNNNLENNTTETYISSQVLVYIEDKLNPSNAPDKLAKKAEVPTAAPN
jgi:hypothetical protein